jgi:hypothetical protein
MNSFAQTINYMAGAIDMITKNTSLNSRQISELKRGTPGRASNRGPSARGRGVSRGGRTNQHNARGRSNRGRGRNRDSIDNDLSQAQKNQIYRERDRIETVHTVAAILREDNIHGDDVSTITGTVPQSQVQIVSGQNEPNASIAGTTRSLNQISLDNVGQAFSRRQLNALMSGARKTREPSILLRSTIP